MKHLRVLLSSRKLMNRLDVVPLVLDASIVVLVIPIRPLGLLDRNVVPCIVRPLVLILVVPLNKQQRPVRFSLIAFVPIVLRTVRPPLKARMLPVTSLLSYRPACLLLMSICTVAMKVRKEVPAGVTFIRFP